MTPVERRAGEALELLDQGRWFALVSGRQTGKTTLLQWFAKALTARGDRLVLWVDLETARTSPDPADAIRLVLGVLGEAVGRAAPTMRRPSDGDCERWLVNGGGKIEREYALGKGALDLLIEWKTQRIAIEVKLRRDTETEDEALGQVLRYLDALGLSEGWLVLFDLRSTAPWSERLFTRTRDVDGRVVRVVGC